MERRPVYLSIQKGNYNVYKITDPVFRLDRFSQPYSTASKTIPDKSLPDRVSGLQVTIWILCYLFQSLFRAGFDDAPKKKKSCKYLILQDLTYRCRLLAFNVAER